MFNPADYLPDFTFRESLVTLGNSPVVLANSSPNRVLVHFENQNPNPCTIALTTAMLGQGGGLLLLAQTYREFDWLTHGALTTLPWYGQSAFSGIKLYVLELFFQP